MSGQGAGNPATNSPPPSVIDGGLINHSKLLSHLEILDTVGKVTGSIKRQSHTSRNGRLGFLWFIFPIFEYFQVFYFQKDNTKDHQFSLYFVKSIFK